MRRSTRFTALVLALAMLAGCFGHFPLTQATYKINAGVTQNKYAQTVIFWGLIIIPVYEVALIGDILILNPIEFWTGVRVLQVTWCPSSDLYMVAKPSEDGKDAIVIISHKDGAVLCEDRITKTAEDTFEVYDSGGALKATIYKNGAGYALK